MDILLLSKKKVIIASYTHILKNKFTTIGGPGIALRSYLANHSRKLVCIWQPLPMSDTLAVRIEIFENSLLTRTIKVPVINWPFGRKKFISFIYLVLKLRDISSVFLFFILYRDKFDIYIGVEAVNTLLGIFFKKLGLVKKVIYYNLDYGRNRFPNFLLNFAFHSLDKLAINHADYSWNLCKNMIEERENIGAIKKNAPVHIVVPIGVNFYGINRLPLERINKKSLVYLGTLNPQQGVQLIIEAFPEILKKIPDASLLIIGSGEFEQNLKRMVDMLGIRENVRFTGIISDEEAEKFLCQAAIGIAPYLDEAFSNKRYTEPTKPKTYLACGLPVIITRVPLIAEEIEREGAGMAVSYDKEDFIRAVERLLSDGKLYEQYRKNAIRLAAKYDWQHIFADAFSIVN